MAKTVKEQLPGAWVVSSKDRGRKKISKGNIYLEDKEEFEIELYNPTQKNLLAIISLDGKSICSSGLIVKRGERIYLDCFVDDRKKFLFETYSVDNTVEGENATRQNGLLEVLFYNEKVTTPFNPPNDYYFGNSRSCFSVGDNAKSWSTNGTGGGANLFSTNSLSGTETNISGSSTNTSTSTALCSDCTYTDNITFTTSTSTAKLSAEIETGQVSKGESSDQSFVEVDMNFESYIVSSITYKLLPESRKPIEKEDLMSNQKRLERTYKDGLAAEIVKIKGLYEEGILDEEEFKMAKAKLLTTV